MAVFRSVLRCARNQCLIFSSHKLLLGSIPTPLIPRTLESVIVRNFADLKVKDDIEMCPITSLEDNKRLAEMGLSQSPELLDKIVAHILSKDYRVQKIPLMLNKKLSPISIGDAGKKRHRYGLPEEVTIGKYNPSDYNLIDSNLTKLLGKLNLGDQRVTVIKELFKHSDEEFHLEKANVLGSFLSRGLPVLRLPCEVYHKSTIFQNNIFLKAKAKAPFSEEEDFKIKSLVKYNEDNNRGRYSGLGKLARELGRQESSITTRMIHLFEAYPAKGRFDREENREIMVALIDFIGEGGHRKMLEYPFGTEHQAWVTLSEKLERPRASLYKHYSKFIKPKLTNYVNGVDESKDMTLLLIQACVENNWVYSQDIDCDELIKDQRFEGTTVTQLRRYYHTAKGNTKKKYLEIKEHEVTSEFILKSYLNERTQGKKHTRKMFNQLVQDYEDLRSDSTSKRVNK